MVIGTAHALVRSDDDIANLAVFRLDLFPAVKITHVDVIRRTGQNASHCINQLVEIGLCCCQILLRLFQLGRRDQIHGVGDFHDIIDAFNPIPDFTHIAHNQFTCFL